MADPFTVVCSDGTIIANPHMHTGGRCQCPCHHDPPEPCWRMSWGGYSYMSGPPTPCDCKRCPDCDAFVDPRYAALHAACCGPRRAYLHCVATGQAFDPSAWQEVLRALGRLASHDAERDRPLAEGEVRCDACGFPTPDDLRCHVCLRRLPW